MMAKALAAERRKKMKQLIVKMRAGECDVTERWLLQYFMKWGRELSEDDVELLKEIRNDSQSPHDAWLRGLMARYGCGRKKNGYRALEILKSWEGDPLCTALLGDLYSWMIEYELAFICWQCSADAGCSEGIYGLGLTYWGGYGVEKDEERAFKLWCKAAEMMHPGALLQLGDCYLRGQAVKQDAKAGLRYYAQAIDLGNRRAIYNLAAAYHCGWGVAQDLRRAASLYRQALLEGVTDAQKRLDDMKRDHPQVVIPYGEWRPDKFIHQWVSDEMHHQMHTVLLMHARRGPLFSALPRDIVVHHICFWICTK